MAHYVLLNPDGVSTFGLAVIVKATTGVVYGNECDGLSADLRKQEGFLVPVHSVDVRSDGDELNVERALRAFFEDEFKGHPYDRELWTPVRTDRLAELVSRVPMWRTSEHLERDDRLYLALDRDQLEEATEAWVPVLTPHGPGVLVFENSA
jgi:hypothetical protein